MQAQTTTKAVILARGLGTRMRAPDSAAALDTAAAAVADSGVKAMIPVGRPFLDYVLSALADAGFTDACLVIGPEHGAVRKHYEIDARPARIRVRFAVQRQPLGTADAVLAAEEFAAGDPFVVLNSDNYYPAAALAELHRRSELAMVAFARDALIERGNVPRERVARFGAIEVDAAGMLRSMTSDEARAAASTGGRVYCSMNCWLLTSAIFAACRDVPLSRRGEKELTQAVQHAIDALGARFEVVFSRDPVLDLSSRADVARVAKFLREVDPRP
ncbi:MAG: nucleotidyltransferase family protein [Gemmatimonadaceae bacterium]|nr:nucleotidyltransferase family protein [Gemmatimonadaceae bacterium]